jgi:ubiquinone/menaquinone biosynthesis C-methylase UbiE
MKFNKKVTRGSGILEEFLSVQRSNKANKLISDEKRSGRLLDIGCGFFPYFLSNIAFQEKFGIDPALSTNSIKGLSLKKINISNIDLPFVDKYFDVVTMLAVFEHIEKERLNHVLQEVLRVLKHNGIYIVTTPAPWSDKLLHQMAKFGLISSEEIHEHKSHYNKDTIVDMIKDAGFKNIESGYFELGFNMWFTVKK